MRSYGWRARTTADGDSIADNDDWQSIAAISTETPDDRMNFLHLYEPLYTVSE